MPQGVTYVLIRKCYLCPEAVQLTPRAEYLSPLWGSRPGLFIFRASGAPQVHRSPAHLRHPGAAPVRWTL